MNKKGFSNISLLFFSLMFIIVWAMFAAPILATWGAQAVINGGYTGFAAFFYHNLNLLIGIVFLIAVLALAFGGGGGQ